jgi:hypothetical protein
MPRPAMEQCRAHVAAQKAARKPALDLSTSDYEVQAADHEQEISTPIADAIELWRLTMKRHDGENPRNVLRKAAVDLYEQLRIDATVHPRSHRAACQAVAAALTHMGQDIPADEARRILEEAKAGDVDDADDEDDAKDDAKAKGEKEEKPREPKQADILVAEAKAAKLFHTPDGEEFADIIIGGRRETHRIRGKGFRQWLRHQYFLQRGSGCSSEALQVAVETIAAFAQFKGEEHEVHCRIAEHAGIYIDMGDKTWRAIEITELGWKVVDEPPVRFRRSPSTRALPMPVSGGSIKALREFANLKKIDGKGSGGKADAEFVVLVGHILAVLRPNASYPVLALLGEHGTCKSTLSSIISRLVDPRSPEQRSPPTSEEDLIVAATGAHVLAYDNISTLPDWLSDGFCRLSTGGGAGKRRLYSDSDEILFHGRRPIFLTGIEDFVQRADLVDRCNIFGLEAVKEDERLSDSELTAKFNKSAPAILGALLDGLVIGLKYLPEVKIDDKPRMADFVLWAEACTRAYWPAGTFVEAYRKSQAASVELVLEASTVGSAVIRFMEGRDEWKGQASELLDQLTTLVGERAAKEREWPKRPNMLSGKLRRAAPALRKTGIHVAFPPRVGHASTRVISITARRHTEQRPETSPASSASAAENKKPDEINTICGNDADDLPTMADNQGSSGAGDPPTVTPGATVGTKPLNKKAADDADGADGIFPHQSGGTRSGNGADALVDRVCAQCGGGISTGSDAPTVKVGLHVWVHDGSCRKFWVRAHPEAGYST